MITPKHHRLSITRQCALMRVSRSSFYYHGKGAWRDNVFTERLWWSLKYECVKINEYADPCSLRKGLATWIVFYNSERPHSSLENHPPDEAYFRALPKAA
jgi:putative transposase